MEIFKIVKVNRIHPETYYLQDYEGKEIQGQFYKQELRKVANNDAYLVEKVVKRKKNQALVKYWGFDDKSSTWIDEKDLDI